MSPQALARIWRPRTFSQMSGQEPVKKALINALQQKRLHHAYLFTGTHGVGKTTVARILAKALNCEQGISPEPCLLCTTCLAIEEGHFIDLIEIDGASKTRVEDTRELLENIQYAPSSGRFKIYLIDEVHMLSQHSFNALLKTLEEPPEHVKFILATTDPQKLPMTVLSRCLQFHLRNLTPELICQHLETVLNKEQLAYESKALELLAHAARGSMRDALSLLDQAILSCAQTLRVEDIQLILGYTQQDYALRLLYALAEQNAQALFGITQNIVVEGGHFHYVLTELLNKLHQIALFQHLGDTNPLISPAPELKILASSFSAEDIQLFYQIALKGQEEIQLAPTLSIGFNMTLLRMLTFRPAPKAPTPPLFHPKSKEPSSTSEEKHPIQQAQEAQKKETPLMDTKNWNGVILQLGLSGLALNALENTEFVSLQGKELHLRVAKGHLSLFNPSTVKRIETAFSEQLQHPIQLTLSSDESIQASPAQQKNKQTQQQHQNAELALMSDPFFQQLKHDFSAELVQNSVAPLKEDS